MSKLSVKDLIRAIREKEELVAILSHMATLLQNEYVGDELQDPTVLIEYIPSYSDRAVFVSADSISKMIQSLQQQAAAIEAELDSMEVNVTSTPQADSESGGGITITE